MGQPHPREIVLHQPFYAVTSTVATGGFLNLHRRSGIAPPLPPYSNGAGRRPHERGSIRTPWSFRSRGSWGAFGPPARNRRRTVDLRQLYGISFWDPLASAATALAIWAPNAALIPASVAAYILPMTALRAD